MTHTSTRREILLAAGVGAGFVLCYSSVIAGIVRVWSTNYLYSYGFAVPLISAYMLCARAKELRLAPRGPDYVSGTLVTTAGIILLLIGHLGAVESVEAVSLVVTLLGATLLLFGRRVFRIAWFPIMYLMLGIPVWDRAVAQLQIPSQLLSASLAVKMLRLVGIPAMQDHTFVVLPNVTLDVLRECSGVNQLISLVTMAAAAAYIWLRSHPRRIVLVALSVVVAYVSNGVRIALVGVLSYRNLNSGSAGVLHLMEGLVVSLIGYAAIFGCLSLLSKTNPMRFRRDESASAGPSAEPARRPAIRRLASLDVALVTLLLCAAVFRATFHAPAVRLHGDLGEFPTEIADWFTDPTLASTPAFRLVRADNELVRVYRHPSGQTIRLYVGYLQNQTEGKELTDGRTGAAAGSTSHLRLTLGSHAVELIQVVQQNGEGQTGALIWYDVNGRILSNLYVAKGYVVWDALTRRRTNAAMVTIEWTAGSPDHLERSRTRVLEFADAVVPVLRDYLRRSPRAYAAAAP